MTDTDRKRLPWRDWLWLRLELVLADLRVPRIWRHRLYTYGPAAFWSIVAALLLWGAHA